MDKSKEDVFSFHFFVVLDFKDLIISSLVFLMCYCSFSYKCVSDYWTNLVILRNLKANEPYSFEIMRFSCETLS